MPRSISFVFFSLSLEYSCNIYTHIYLKSIIKHLSPKHKDHTYIFPRAQVKRPLVCAPKSYSLYWKFYSAVSFLITCKAASHDFYCPAHWLDFQQAHWQHTEIRTRRQATTGHCPVNMIWKQWCQASKQQGHISKKLWSCRELWLWAGPAGSGTTIQW